MVARCTTFYYKYLGNYTSVFKVETGFEVEKIRCNIPCWISTKRRSKWRFRRHHELVCPPREILGALVKKYLWALSPSVCKKIPCTFRSFVRNLYESLSQIENSIMAVIRPYSQCNVNG